MSIFTKTLNVINSCETYEQCVVARDYLELARMTSHHLDFCNEELRKVTNRCWQAVNGYYDLNMYTDVEPEAELVDSFKYIRNGAVWFVIITALLLPFFTVAII